MVRSRYALLLVLAVAVPLSALPAGAFAAAGDLDSSFGEGGIAIAKIYRGYPEDLAIDHQGRIVVAGRRAQPVSSVFPAVARFRPDGSLDPSFSREGVFEGQWCSTVHGASVFGYVSVVAIDSADRIVLVGRAADAYSSPDICVVRLLSNGELDPSFGEGGKLTLTEYGEAKDVAIDGAGRILITGTYGMTAIRLTDSGALDPSFGDRGVTSLRFGEGAEARAIAIESSGKIVLAGSAMVFRRPQIAVARLDANGFPDQSFAGFGFEALSFAGPPASRVGTDVVGDSLGRLTLSATENLEGKRTALGGRLLPNGALDTSFGQGGWVRLSLGGESSGRGIALDQAGRVLLSGGIDGSEFNSAAGEAFLARLGADGVLDGSFGAGGVVRPASFSGEGAVEVDSAGRYLLSGSSSVTFGVARYLSETPVPPVGPQYRCRGRLATLVGTPGRDVLKGTKGRDVIAGLGGDDAIRGFRGRDVICGDAGRDRLFGGRGNDKLFGGKGADLLVGGKGRDRLRGGPGRDVQR